MYRYPGDRGYWQPQRPFPGFDTLALLVFLFGPGLAVLLGTALMLPLMVAVRVWQNH